MKKIAAVIFCSLLLPFPIGASNAETVVFSTAEIDSILTFGPWPPVTKDDPSNRVSGNADAVSLGKKLFFSPKLSKDGNTSCATCHQPENGFTERKSRAELSIRADRNTQSLLNAKYQRWFGWDGSHDNLWAQSFAPLLKANEMDLPSEQLLQIMNETEFKSKYNALFGAAVEQSSDIRLVNVGKALAAYVETLKTGKTPFDQFRDALERTDTPEVKEYPEAAKRGLKIFLGKGSCTSCHSGALFSNGEFHDAGVQYFVEAGRVDEGRHVGIKNLRSNRFTLDGDFTDDPDKAGAWKVRRVVEKHSDFGTFRVPSLRNIERTAPYMHDGRLAALEDVVEHYSNIDLERLHADGELILKPLNLSERESTDLIAFLKSLTAPDVEY